MEQEGMVQEGMGHEQEPQPAARIYMDMARHGLKGPKPREALSKEGIEGAVEAGLGKVQPAPAGDVYGSPRERTGQSSVFRMYAEQLQHVTGWDFDPEEFVRWLEKGGLSKTETPFLNFQVGEGEYNKEFMENFLKGEYFKWITERSDAAALEFKQKPESVTPFSIQAGNVGSFIFAEVWAAYDRLGKGETVEPRVDFATSHQGVLESFLYKVIKKHSGDDLAAHLVESLNNQGFAENQGFSVEVKILDPHDPKAWNVTVVYGDTPFVLPSAEVLEIIKEGQDLKTALAELQK